MEGYVPLLKSRCVVPLCCVTLILPSSLLRRKICERSQICVGFSQALSLEEKSVNKASVVLASLIPRPEEASGLGTRLCVGISQCSLIVRREWIFLQLTVFLLFFLAREAAILVSPTSIQKGDTGSVIVGGRMFSTQKPLPSFKR